MKFLITFYGLEGAVGGFNLTRLVYDRSLLFFPPSAPQLLIEFFPRTHFSIFEILIT